MKIKTAPNGRKYVTGMPRHPAAGKSKRLWLARLRKYESMGSTPEVVCQTCCKMLRFDGTGETVFVVTNLGCDPSDESPESKLAICRECLNLRKKTMEFSI